MTPRPAQDSRLPGGWVAIAVLAAWAVSITWYVMERRASSTGTWDAADISEGFVKPRENWFRAEKDGGKIGFSHEARETRGDTVYLNQESVMRLPVMGRTLETRIDLRSELTTKGELKTFKVSIVTDLTRFEAVGKAEGNVVETVITIGGASRKEIIRLDRPPVLDVNLMDRIGGQKLAPGKTFNLEIFDPQSMTQHPVKVLVEARENIVIMGKQVSAWRLKQELMGMSLRMWINEKGEPLISEGPLGIRTVLTTKEDALAEEAEADIQDLIAQTEVVPDKEIEDIAGVRKLVLSVEGENLDAGKVNDRRQTVEGKRLTLIADTLSASPVSLAQARAGNEAFLAPTATLQSDHPDVVKKAKEILGGETQALPAARKLYDYVYKDVAKRNVIGIPNTLEVLRNMTGDCNEHTALYVGLARAMGLPARINAGLTYLNGRFAYHAWPEVFVGQWMAVDPTLGQFPADVGHIRLATGDLNEQVEIIRLMGKLRIKVEAVERK